MGKELAEKFEIAADRGKILPLSAMPVYVGALPSSEKRRPAPKPWRQLPTHSGGTDGRTQWNDYGIFTASGSSEAEVIRMSNWAVVGRSNMFQAGLSRVSAAGPRNEWRAT